MGYEVADLTAELSAAREEGAKTERTCAELSETLEEEREAKGAAEASLSSLEEHQSFLLEELKNDSKAQKRILDLLRAEKADLEAVVAASVPIGGVVLFTDLVRKRVDHAYASYQ